MGLGSPALCCRSVAASWPTVRPEPISSSDRNIAMVYLQITLKIAEANRAAAAKVYQT
jgi:hypothetical protein